MAQKPYTIYNINHSSEHYTLKRDAKCVQCCHGDFIENANVTMPKGTEVIKVTLSFGPASRTQHFHPECYVHHFEWVKRCLLNDTSKVYPILDSSNVKEFPMTNEELLNRRIERECRPEDDE